MLRDIANQFDTINRAVDQTMNALSRINVFMEPVCWHAALNGAALTLSVCPNNIVDSVRAHPATLEIPTSNAHQVKFYGDWCVLNCIFFNLFVFF